jgi:anion-transporting  ArsA/GET3 family ATPase
MTNLLEGKRLVICAGPGGAGKTTASAAIALGAAAAGAKVARITIDPARQCAVPLGAGESVSELTLDPKRTFDELVDELAPDARRAAELKSNRVYRVLSAAISGSQEFAAVAKLVDLERTGGFDVVVLDMPPSRHALDLVNSPRRLTPFLDSRAYRAFKGPAGIGLGVLGRGASPLVGGMRRLSGAEVLADASTFFRLLGEMSDDFSRRATQVEVMLRSPTTAFLLITTAEREPIDETISLAGTLVEGRLPLTGVVVNQVHESLGSKPSQSDLDGLLTRWFSSDLASRVTASAEAHEALARRDERTMSRVPRALPGTPILTIPYFPRGVIDVEALREVHGRLFGPTPGKRASATAANR